MVEELHNQTENQPQQEDEYEYEYIEIPEGEELPDDGEYEYEYIEVPADENSSSVSAEIRTPGEAVQTTDEVSGDILLHEGEEKISAISLENQAIQKSESDQNMTGEVREELLPDTAFVSEVEHEQIMTEDSTHVDSHVMPICDTGERKEPIFTQNMYELESADDLPRFQINEPDESEKQDYDIAIPEEETEKETRLFEPHFDLAEKLVTDDQNTSDLGIQSSEEVRETSVDLSDLLISAQENNTMELAEPSAQDTFLVQEKDELSLDELLAESGDEARVDKFLENNAANYEHRQYGAVSVTPSEREMAQEKVFEEKAEPIVETEEQPTEEVELAPEEQTAVEAEPIVEAEEFPTEKVELAPEVKTLPIADSSGLRGGVSVVGLEEDVPELQPIYAVKRSPQQMEEYFQQTEEVPVEVSCKNINESDFEKLKSVCYGFNKNSGFQKFQADENIYNLFLNDIDFEAHELEDWSLIIFDDYRMRLNPHEKELVLPKADNVVRYAKLLKGGKTKLELFNEQQYNFMIPTEEFVKIKGHFIYGNIANNSKLIIKDFVNVSLADKVGKIIHFNKPVSGLLVGPRAAKLYFSDVREVVLPYKAPVSGSIERDMSHALRWYSGHSDDKSFEFNAQSHDDEFIGTQDCRIIHVNVGISTYGWNITFENGLFMSFRDLQEYQTRYGQLPDQSGVITHGKQMLKFSAVEKIVIYETAQYFTYG